VAKLNIHGVSAMMGRQSCHQYKFFLSGFSLEKRVRKEHVLRKITETIDFNFIYGEVKDTYGANGNVSVPPPVILKMMLLLILYNVRSERELMMTIPERMDWMWFLGYDLDDEIPNHSVLSKARSRWGVEAFRRFFERIVWQCVEAGLVDGSKLFVDASLIQADASNHSVVNREKLQKELEKGYLHLEQRLDDVREPKAPAANSRFISTTDPDSSVTRHSAGESKLRYKTHRGVDPQHEVITSTMVTPGSADEGAVLKEVIQGHEQNTDRKVKTVVADSRYGTTENFLFCHDAGIQAHMPSLEESQRGLGRQDDIFPKEVFAYDPDRDCFICPAGQELRPRHFYKARKHTEYKAASGVCARCPLRPKCTRSKDGRTLKRHMRQEDLDCMRRQSQSSESQRDIKTRQHLSERSFARSVRYGYKRARWRRLWRVRIQDFLIAAIQNIIVLIRHSMGILSKSRAPMARAIELLFSLLKKTGLSLIPFWVCSISRLPMPTIRFEQQPVYSLQKWDPGGKKGLKSKDKDATPLPCKIRMGWLKEDRGGFQTRPYGEGWIYGLVREPTLQRDQIDLGTRLRAPSRFYIGREGGFQMLEYAVAAGALLGEKISSFFNFDSLSDYAWILGAGVALAGLGYLIKGLWGSFIALLIGAFFFLYMKDFLPFWFLFQPPGAFCTKVAFSLFKKSATNHSLYLERFLSNFLFW
jgi:transposase